MLFHVLIVSVLLFLQGALTAPSPNPSVFNAKARNRRPPPRRPSLSLTKKVKPSTPVVSNSLNESINISTANNNPSSPGGSSTPSLSTSINLGIQESVSSPASSSTTTTAPPTFAKSPAQSGEFDGSKTFTGEGTYYDVGMGACGKINTNSELVAAINTKQYGVHANPNKAPICGQCMLVKGPNNSSVKVKVVDRCPVCEFGDLDLSPTAFVKLSPLAVGRIKISWNYVPC
ncbi:hypothetical protein BB560_002035 [Smittium megazygosporum]|uniref:RlpA-like protein double-psi beta-barrel domain-containing protein n=1 Tax=Smittium megazygosporum TaxID=133381 RepID=A0A2T9ZFY5_9FUNG|nr:hypothetical protein BB560_002035 [Smittium megazygosporum]